MDADTTALVEPVLVTSSLAFLARLEVDVTLRSSTGQYDEGYEHCVTVWLDAASHVRSFRHRSEKPGLPQSSFTQRRTRIPPSTLPNLWYCHQVLLHTPGKYLRLQLHRRAQRCARPAHTV